MNQTLLLEFCLLLLLLLMSGFFSLAETSMIAASKPMLKSRADHHKGARLACQLLRNTESLLGVVLLFNNLINAATATLVSAVTIQLFGNNEWVFGLATLFVTFMILVFSEITPKVIGARHANAIAPWIAYVLSPLLRWTSWATAQ